MEWRGKCFVYYGFEFPVKKVTFVETLVSIHNRWHCNGIFCFRFYLFYCFWLQCHLLEIKILFTAKLRAKTNSFLAFYLKRQTAQSVGYLFRSLRYVSPSTLVYVIIKNKSNIIVHFKEPLMNLNLTKIPSNNSIRRKIWLIFSLEILQSFRLVSLWTTNRLKFRKQKILWQVIPPIKRNEKRRPYTNTEWECNKNRISPKKAFRSCL